MVIGTRKVGGQAIEGRVAGIWQACRTHKGEFFQVGPGWVGQQAGKVQKVSFSQKVNRNGMGVLRLRTCSVLVETGKNVEGKEGQVGNKVVICNRTQYTRLCGCR